MTLSQVIKLQRIINERIKKKFKIATTTPNNLLFGHPSSGGLGLTHLWDEMNIEKTVLFMSAINNGAIQIYQKLVHTDYINKVMEGAIYRLQLIIVSKLKIFYINLVKF